MTAARRACVAGFGTGPSTDGIGLVHAISSLSGILSISFSACRELMPDPEFYGQCIEDSYKELAAAMAKGASPAPARKGRRQGRQRSAQAACEGRAEGLTGRFERGEERRDRADMPPGQRRAAMSQACWMPGSATN